MKSIQKVSALLVASASFSMAGVINIYTEDAKDTLASLNLTTIDSLTFSGKAEKKEMGLSGKTKQKAIKLSDMDYMEFTLKDKSKETMTVTVGEGIFAGDHTFKLSEIKNIEIVEMDSDEDMDEDGISDLDEIYKYDTNPKSPDTDGDGWTDSEELADGMYSPTNPTKFNPRIADVPGLRVTLKKSPIISLNITTSEEKNESVSISEGSEVSKTTATSLEQTRSADIMHSWNFSTTHGWELGKEGNDFVGKYVANFTIGYNGSYTTSTGMTWGSSEEKSVAQSYERAVSTEKSKGSEINGATVCMQVELKNTSDIGFTIEALRLSASTYDIKDTCSLKILAELNRKGEWSDITLAPTEATEALFCDSDVKVEQIENLIYNTSAIVLGSSSQKITFNSGNSDFTKEYTKVAAKTADITIDYGPGTENPERYHVATNYRYNPDHKGDDDMYAQTTLAELLRNAHVNFKQDTIEGPEGKKLYGLDSIGKFGFSLTDSAMWYLSIQRAADIKKGNNQGDLISFAKGSYDIEKIFIGAGDAVQLNYSKDYDNDGIPLTTEHILGTSDTLTDSDNDSIPDYDEITGWVPEGSTDTVRTNPTNPDTDGDDIRDLHDPKPTRRAMFTDASLSTLEVFAPNQSKALLSEDSTALKSANKFNVNVQGPMVEIKVVPKANSVSWVKFTKDSLVQFAQPVVENDKKVYSFNAAQLTIMKSTTVKIEVKSEDEETVKAYSVSISSTLIPPTNLSLGKNKERKTIFVNYTPSTDSRVKGYVILRGDSSATLPATIDNRTTINNEGTYNTFSTFVVDSSISSFADGVDGGSPYYSYRVFAYTMEGSDMVFSTGTEQHTRSVGRIKVTFSMDDFGGEYYYYSSGRAYISANVSLHAGDSHGARTISSWYGYDWKAGLVDEGYTVVFLSRVCDSKDVKPDYGTYSTTIGSEGLYLWFDVFSKSDDDDTYKYSSKAQVGLSWPYDKMADVLLNGGKGTGKGGEAPYKGQIKYIVGQDGVGINTADNDCGCGDEPHTGYKFTFNYDWVDDADTY